MLPNSQQRRSDPESEQPAQTYPIQHKAAPNPADKPVRERKWQAPRAAGRTRTLGGRKRGTDGWMDRYSDRGADASVRRRRRVGHAKTKAWDDWSRRRGRRARCREGGGAGTSSSPARAKASWIRATAAGEVGLGAPQI
jgi:hypothetical protein